VEEMIDSSTGVIGRRVIFMVSQTGGEAAANRRKFHSCPNT
jgi:hypothetical protein